MSKKAVVTGVTGMDGSHMVDYLLENTDLHVYGGVRRLSVPNHKNIEHNLNNSRFDLIDLDLLDPHNISGVIEKIKPDYFINFAAQSFVGCSWDMPVATWKTNVDSVLHILEAIRKHNPKTRFYHAGCYDKKTKIITPSGIKSIDEISEGDLVLSLNPVNSSVEYKKVVKRVKYNHKGKMIKIKGVGKNLVVTPNHNMYYESKNGKLLNCKAENFIKKSTAQFPFSRGFNGEKMPEITDLTPFISDKKFDKKVEATEINSIDLMYLMGIFIGDGSCRILKKKSFASDHSNRKRGSDGRYKEVESNEKRDVIYQCAQAIIDIPKSDPAFKKLTNVLNKNGISWSLQGQCGVTFHSWGLNHFFNQCGNSSSSKMIPQWIFNLDKVYQKALFDGIMDSDGCWSRKNIEQTSKILSEQLFVLSANIGLNCVSKERPPRTETLKNGRVIEGKFATFTNSFSNRKRFFRNKINTIWFKQNKGYEIIDYDDEVWCLEVEDNHNFMIYREGVSMFCGNSSEEFGDVQYSPQNEEHPLRPRSPYGASKAAGRHLVKVYRESYNLYAVQGWLFNHEGKRRGDQFVTQKIAKEVARIRTAMFNGEKFEPMKLGNMSSQRDWSYSPDFVDAVWRMLNQEVYNIKLKESLVSQPVDSWKNLVSNLKEYVCASGETHTVAEFVSLAFEAAGIDVSLQKDGDDWSNAKFVLTLNPEIVVAEVDPKFFRPAEVELLLGDSSKLREDLNWQPHCDFKTLVEKMVNNQIKEKI